MRISHLILKDFRNYQSCDLKFSHQICVLVGDNAQGKTNLLESIYFLSNARLFRTSDEKACIRFNQEFALIKASLDHDINLKVVVHPKGKTLFVQNQLLKKTSEFVGKLNAVLFSPSDLDLFEASPKARRYLIDVELGKINPTYMHYLSHYNRTLKERNALLKETKLDHTYLEVLTRQLIDDQKILIPIRKIFVSQLNDEIIKIFPKLSLVNNTVQMRLMGISEEEDLEESLVKRYEKSLERDVLFKQTHVGIHRDDLHFTLDDQEVSEVASQGQKRMFVIAIKAALVNVIATYTHERPVLLLDDVFSELDAKRREALYLFLHNQGQTIITSTDEESIEPWLKEKVQFIDVVEGKIVERS
jgi:DNA replication and repair protein RecF